MSRGVCYNCKDKVFPSCYSTCEGKLEEDRKRELIKQTRMVNNMMNGHVIDTRQRFTGYKKGKF